MRVALIGCGKIADQHVWAMRRTGAGRCELVAVCDRELLMAEQLAERFTVGGCFSDVTEMLREARPDAVHITTPPLGHFPLGRQCLEAGCHVYLEKPFTITADEAEELLGLAEAKGLQITAGHNLQFAPEMLAMRRVIGDGFLGGEPVHVESHFSYSLGEASYVAPILGDRDHWVRRLPGQLFHNIVSHGVAKLAEFLDEGDGSLEVVARASQSPELRDMGGGEVMDELRVMLRDCRGTTAYFCFSTRLRPGLNRLQVSGPGGTLVADHVSGTLLRFPARSDKSYLTFFLPPLRAARQHLANGMGNVWRFVRRRLYQDAGMKELVARFYESIRAGGSPAIPHREILLTARVMDEVFAQVYGGEQRRGGRSLQVGPADASGSGAARTGEKEGDGKTGQRVLTATGERP